MKKETYHFPLMLMAMFSLITALLGGLIRLGWDLPSTLFTLAMLHSLLMVSGFLGALICLERAVALNNIWTYIPPILTGAGAIMLITGYWIEYAPVLIAIGSLGLVFVFVYIYQIQPALHSFIMGIGALSWFGGNLLLILGYPVFKIVLWMAGFLILTIAGERLELTRMLKPTVVSRILFILCILIFLSGMVYSIVSSEYGVRIAGTGMIFLAIWLIRYDIAKRTVRQAGLTRFIAICLLSGYVWLFISGLMSLAYGDVIAGPYYDAILHAVFLGFVFVMIFGHAPIIFPAVLGKPINFHPRFYIHLIFLHATLILRITGDLFGWLPGREWGGLLNAIAIVMFFINTISATRFRSV